MVMYNDRKEEKGRARKKERKDKREKEEKEAKEGKGENRLFVSTTGHRMKTNELVLASLVHPLAFPCDKIYKQLQRGRSGSQ